MATPSQVFFMITVTGFAEAIVLWDQECLPPPSQHCPSTILCNNVFCLTTHHASDFSLLLVMCSVRWKIDMERFAKTSLKKANIKHKNICHVSIAYPYINNYDKFHYLLRFRIIYTVFCFVLQFEIYFLVLNWISSVHFTYPQNITRFITTVLLYCHPTWPHSFVQTCPTCL